MDRRWWTLIIVNVATFMLLLDITIVNVALPSIQEDLGTSFTELQWVIDAYSLALAALTLVAGSLADRLGRRRMFVWGLVIFTVASGLCALSRGPLVLDAARGLQGIGGAAMFSVTLAIIAQEFRGHELGRAMGVYGATIGLAVAIGPLVGGALTESLGWESIFYLNIPIGILAVLLSQRFLRESRDPDASTPDWVGTALFSGALFLLVFALLRGNDEGWGSALIVTMLLISVVLLASFLAYERRAAKPMLPLGNFRNPAFTGTHIAAFAISSSMFALFLYLTLYMQNILGLTPLETGVRFLPITVTSFFAAPIAGAALGRIPVRVNYAVGLAMVGTGLLLMANVHAGDTWTTLLLGFLIAGVGIGITNPAIASAAVATVPPQQSGMGSGVNNTFRQVGIATGIAGLGAIFQSRSESKAIEALSGTPLQGDPRTHDLLHGIASGDAATVLGSVPRGVARFLAPAAEAGFISAFNEILVIGAIIAFAGAAISFFLLRGFRLDGGGARPAPDSAVKPESSTAAA